MKLIRLTSIALAIASTIFLTGCPGPKKPTPSQTITRAGTGASQQTAPAQNQNAPTSFTPIDISSTYVPTNDGEMIPVRNDNETALSADGRGLLDSVYFDLNQYGIKAAERSKAQAAKDYLDQNPAARLLLEGHCDWRGTAEYNLGLGDRRANSVKKFLQDLGVSPERLDILSFGSQNAVERADEATMARDRRVEFVIKK